MKRKRKKKKSVDERITIRHTWLRDSMIIFLALMVINSAHSLIFMSVFEIEPTFGNMLAIELVSFIVFASAIVSILVMVFRRKAIYKPMKKLSEAAKKVTEGDFSVRLEPLRKDGKKDQVGVMFDDFNTMIEELNTIETLKNDFIVSVSHEIKTPLSVIQNYAKALKRDQITKEEKEDYIETIVSACGKLTALVTNILKLNKLENQEIVGVYPAYDLSEQLRYCILGYESQWEEKNIQVEAEIEDNIRVAYDESMLEIVWNNLISNAVKFTEPGGQISVKLMSEGGYVYVGVTDNGCGMDKDTKEHIFDKFYQGDTSRSQEGNGLGLALVMKIMEITGGEISVESEQSEYTRFTVRLKTVEEGI